MAASGVVPSLICKQRLASFSGQADSKSHSNCFDGRRSGDRARLIKERVLAGEVELAWDVRRSHQVPPALSDYDKFRRYTAFRPYPVYRHPEQSLQDSIARLRPRRFRRLSHLHPRISQQSTLRDHPGQREKRGGLSRFSGPNLQSPGSDIRIPDSRATPGDCQLHHISVTGSLVES